MPRLGPISRQELIKHLRELGFSGPYSGGKHQFLSRGDRSLILPNPHRGDISVGFLNRILRQAGVSREEWENL